MNNQTTLQYKWSNKVTYDLPQEAKVQLRSWMIPAEACPGTFVALKGACGKTTTTKMMPYFCLAKTQIQKFPFGMLIHIQKYV